MMKRYIPAAALAALTVALFAIAFATTAGPNNFGTFASDGLGNAIWSVPSRATSSDDSRTQTLFDSPGQTSDALECYTAGFSLPAASVQGILIEVERSATAASQVSDAVVNIRKADGTYGSANKGQGGTWPTTDAYTSYGGASDVWGLTWTDTDINDADFGFRISCVSGDASQGRIDHCRITVYYTATPAGGNKRIIGLSQTRSVTLFR